MSQPSCSLSIMVARTDIPFMMHTIPHLIRTCDFPFEKRALVVDTAPLTGDKVGRPGIGTMEQLRANCEQLRDAGLIDLIIDMDYSPEYQHRVYRKHFGSVPRPTHNYKGYPILGTIFSLEEVPGDYLLHFDSDMLLYQKPGYSWIKSGMELFERCPEVMFVRPLSGPPATDGSLVQKFPYHADPRGFYSFKFFGSRCYLLQRERFEQLLPIPVLWTRYQRKWIKQLPASWLTQLNAWTGRGYLDSWEVMVSRQLERTQYARATMAAADAWTVHPIDRGARFIEALPQLIQRIEQGSYPAGQAGHYDLKLDLWL